MSEYKYLISYNFGKKEFSSELNREITTATGFGNLTVTLEGKLTSSTIKELTTKIAELNNFSVVVILNIIRLEKVKRRRSE